MFNHLIEKVMHFLKIIWTFQENTTIFKILYHLETYSFFQSKSNAELFRAILVFKLCGVDFLVQQNQRILATMRVTLGKSLFKKALKATFYGHFVAGETKEEVDFFFLNFLLYFIFLKDIFFMRAHSRTSKRNSSDCFFSFEKF